MRLACVVLVVAAGAWAQGAKPSVMPFPLEFKRVPSAMPKADREGLVSDAERLLRTAGVQLVDFAKAETALADLKRQDCEREDVCLQQLAQKAETLYALYANVDFTLEGMVVVTGRVVRDDGKLVSPSQTVSLPKGTARHREVAQQALTALYQQLKVAELPAVREVVAVAAPVELPKVVEPSLPVPTPEVAAPAAPSPMKLASYVALGAGGAALVAGTVVLLTANPQVDEQGNVVRPEGVTPAEAVAAYRSAKSQQSVGAALAIGGAAVAAGGLVMMLVSGSRSPAPPVALLPTAGGAVLTVGGTFP